MIKLTSAFWIAAYLKRLEREVIPAFIVAKGDETAGDIVIKLSTLDGYACYFQRHYKMDGTRYWAKAYSGEDAEIDEKITSARAFDPDLWVIEIEDKKGQHFLDEIGAE